MNAAHDITKVLRGRHGDGKEGTACFGCSACFSRHKLKPDIEIPMSGLTPDVRGQSRLASAGFVCGCLASNHIVQVSFGLEEALKVIPGFQSPGKDCTLVFEVKQRRPAHA